ncbi:MAG TPA: DUF4175 family protein [Gemmatimonadales bacterium]|jgi:hypothetical protein|nr:DUF4175 family protein [Gemmatimonadales bacterium]
MSPDAAAVAAFVARARRRRARIGAAYGVAVGLVLAFGLGLAGWPAGAWPRTTIINAVILVAIGNVVGAMSMILRRGTVADIERRAPECRNLMITAVELTADHASTPEAVAALVWQRAAHLTEQLRLSTVFPARNAFVCIAAGALLWSLTLHHPGPVAAHLLAPAAAADILQIDVTVIPPTYAGQPTRTLHNPARVAALAGSRVELDVQARAAGVTMETLHGTQPLAARAAAIYHGELVADADGYIAFQATSGNGHTGARRLLGLAVTADNPPHVRIVLPGKDLHLHDGHQTITLRVEASDDIGLASLRLKYTKVAGSGERFTFTEGETPLIIDRTDARTWTAHANWPLDSLKLDQGDMVVYRAVAADTRPGTVPVESDAFLADVLEPGADAAFGLAMDPDEARYAVSQQMVILKTEHLLARKGSMPAATYADSAADIAAEQRRVRAEFVFMMGGELGSEPTSMSELNETAEAEGESELAAGRMVNEGRDALLGAIRFMSRADKSLTDATLPEALGYEHQALTQLQRAFSHKRLILRALTEHERLDLTRRLTGALGAVTSDVLPATTPPVDPRATALRRSLVSIASLAGTGNFAADAAANTTVLAQGVLTVDPSAESLRGVATLLTDAAAAMHSGRTADAHGLLDRATTALAQALRTDLPAAPDATTATPDDQLAGALTDALRRPRTSP